MVKKLNAFGLNKIDGDFVIKNDKVSRFLKGDEIIYYSGLQILNLNILNSFPDQILSFNTVWNYLIDKKKLCGEIMSSNWYHVGDIQGLTIAKKIYP